MPKIKHIAISTQYADSTAKFTSTSSRCKEIAKLNSAGPPVTLQAELARSRV